MTSTTASSRLLADPAAIGDASRVGNAILARMAAREKARVQVELLRALSRLEVSRYLVLCGSAALHGVYLRRRRTTKDIDLRAPYLISTRFVEIARRAGLDVQYREQGSSLCYYAPGTVYPTIAMGIEIFPRANLVLPSCPGEFLAETGETVTVRTAGLADLLAGKIGCVSVRLRAIDFADLFVGLEAAPHLAPEVVRHVRDPRWDNGIFTAPRDIRRHDVMDRLDLLADQWEEELAGVYTVPVAFGAARRGLAEWLRALG